MSNREHQKLGPDYNAFSESAYFDKINTPAKTPEYYERFHKPLVEEAKREAAPHPIVLLDVACGFAYELDFVKDDPSVYIVGIDIASDVLAQAKKRLPNATFIAADTEHSPLAKESADVGMALNAFGYKPDKVLETLYEALKPGKKCAMNFRVYGNTYNDAFFQHYIDQGAVLGDGDLVVGTGEHNKRFKLKVLNY